jgi:ABC-2 type transport system ATP-binding protein
MKLTQIASLAQRPYGRLSGGQKRLVQFAIAICGRPELLFLDEPTVGLDVEARGLLWATVRQLRSSGTAIVLTTHYLEEAEALADRVTRAHRSGPPRSARAYAVGDRAQIRAGVQAG